MALNYQSVDFVKVLGERRSCRFYDPDRPVEAEKVQAICQAARNASHMGNANCITLTIVEDQATKDKFTEIVSAFNIPMAKMAPVSIVFALNRDLWYNGLPVGLPELFKMGGINPSHGWSMDNIENTTLPRLTSFPPEVVSYLLSCETGMAMASAQMPTGGTSPIAATGANQMQRMMAGGVMKRTKPIDGIASKGMTKGKIT